MKFILIIFLFFFSCNLLERPKKTETRELIALGLVLNQGQLSSPKTILEMRPFRGRTVSLNEAGALEIYDWNQDRFIETKAGSEIVTDILDIASSEYGRFAYLRTSNQFRILDSGLNLSPHGDHFHTDRFNVYETIPVSRVNLSPPAGMNLGQIHSRDGWVSFGYSGDPNGQAKYILEKEITKTSPGLQISPNLPANLSSEVIVISKDFLLLPTAGTTKPTEFRVFKKTTSWAEIHPSIVVHCPDYNGVAHTQTPVSNAVFGDLENGYKKIHYIALSCGNKLQVIKHEEANNAQPGSHYEIQTLGVSLKSIQPIFSNSNIESGGKNVRPELVGSEGSGVLNEFFYINLESKVVRRIPTKPYYSKHLATEKRMGKYIYILSSDGKIYSYDSRNLQETKAMSSEISYSKSLNFQTSWDAGFILSGNEIHEFNLEENFKARVVKTSANQKKTNFHGFFGPGSNYE